MEFHLLSVVTLAIFNKKLKTTLTCLTKCLSWDMLDPSRMKSQRRLDFWVMCLRLLKNGLEFKAYGRVLLMSLLVEILLKNSPKLHRDSLRFTRPGRKLWIELTNNATLLSVALMTSLPVNLVAFNLNLSTARNSLTVISELSVIYSLDSTSALVTIS